MADTIVIIDGVRYGFSISAYILWCEQCIATQMDRLADFATVLT